MHARPPAWPGLQLPRWPVGDQKHLTSLHRFPAQLPLLKKHACLLVCPARLLACSPAGEQPMGQRRKHFVVVSLDSDFALPQATTAVKALLQELCSAGLREDVGLGVLSMLGFESTSDHMQVRRRLAACSCCLSSACPALAALNAL